MFFCILKYTSDSLHSSFTSLRRAIFQFCTTTLLRYITHRRLSDLLQWFAMVVHCIIYPTTYVVLHLLCLFLSLTTRTRFTSCLDFWYVRNVSFYVWSHFDKKKKKKHIKRIYIFILFSIKMFQYCVMYTYGMLLSLYVLYSGNKINSNCGPDGNLWGQNNY